MPVSVPITTRWPCPPGPENPRIKIRSKANWAYSGDGFGQAWSARHSIRCRNCGNTRGRRPSATTPGSSAGPDNHGLSAGRRKSPIFSLCLPLPMRSASGGQPGPIRTATSRSGRISTRFLTLCGENTWRSGSLRPRWRSSSGENGSLRIVCGRPTSRDATRQIPATIRKRRRRFSKRYREPCSGRQLTSAR